MVVGRATAAGNTDGADDLVLDAQRHAAAEQQQFRQRGQVAGVGRGGGVPGQLEGGAAGRQRRVGLAPAGLDVVRADAVGALDGHQVAAPVDDGDDDGTAFGAAGCDRGAGQAVGGVERQAVAARRGCQGRLRQQEGAQG